MVQGKPKHLEGVDEEWLRERYVVDGMTCEEIADQILCSPAAVRDWLEEWGIETRPPGPRPSGPHDHPGQTTLAEFR